MVKEGSEGAVGYEERLEGIFKTSREFKKKDKKNLGFKNSEKLIY